MNLLDATVTHVIERRETTFDGETFSIVRCEYGCWGSLSETEFWFKGDDREEKANAIQIGHKFLA